MIPSLSLAYMLEKGFTMKKRTISFVLAFCIAFLMMPFATYAALPETAEPLWDNADSVTAKLLFNGSTGNVSATIRGQRGVTNISVSLRLFYKSSYGTWVEIEKDWDYDVDKSSLSIYETFTGISGREYKVEVSGTVTKNGYAEPISYTATATCP